LKTQTKTEDEMSNIRQTIGNLGEILNKERDKLHSLERLEDYYIEIIACITERIERVYPDVPLDMQPRIAKPISFLNDELRTIQSEMKVLDETIQENQKELERVVEMYNTSSVYPRPISFRLHLEVPIILAVLAAVSTLIWMAI